jgi:hypothetical protein
VQLVKMETIGPDVGQKRAAALSAQIESNAAEDHSENRAGYA